MFTFVCLNIIGRGGSVFLGTFDCVFIFILLAKDTKSDAKK